MLFDTLLYNDIFVAKMTNLENEDNMRRKYVNIFRHDFPGLQLPFYPRGTGVNDFGPGEHEEHIPRPFCEIAWVAEGACRFDHGGTPAIANTGESTYWLPGEPHRKYALAEGRTVIYYATFDGPGAVAFLQSFGYARGVLPSGGDLRPLFDRLARGFASPLESAYRALLPVYSELLVRIGEDPRSQSTTDQFAEDCLYFIQSECGDCDFNINNLAERLGVHRSTIGRAVRNATGQSPIAYLEECRLERALQLLRTTHLPIKEIAERTGFRRSNYFCRLIRTTTGLPPLAWRNREMR